MKKEWGESFQKLDEKLTAGKELYEQIVTYTKDGIYFLILPEHMGDSVYAVSFLQAYKEKNDIQTLYIVCTESQRELMCNFIGVDGAVSVSSKEMDELKAFMNTIRPNHPCIRYGHYTQTLKYTYPDFSFEMNYRTDLNVIGSARFWLGLSDDAKPSRMLPFDDGENEELREMFGKSVLLFPKAQSNYGRVPMEIFEMIAAYYSQNGFEVYTNYNDLPYEVIVPGTKPLASTMKELATIAPYFSQVISARSGAVDVLAQCGANLSVIYDSGSVEILSKSDSPILSRSEIALSDILDLVDRDGIVNYQMIRGKEKELIRELILQAK